MIGRVGKAIAGSMGATPGKTAAGALAIGGLGTGAFVSGIDADNQVSDSVYGLAFGDPNYDEYVMGRKMGLRSLMAPFPIERKMQTGVPGAIRYPQTFRNARTKSRMRTPQVDGSIAFGMYNSRLG